MLTPRLVREVYGVECYVLTNPRTGRPVIAFSDPSAAVSSSAAVAQADA